MAREELFELVTEEGEVIGLAPRWACHRQPNLLHRVAHVLVFTHAGDLVLQRRSPLKDIQPDKWDTSVGGHLSPGETPEQAAIREMHEELGVAGVRLQFVHKYLWRSTRESELVYTYRTAYDGPFQPDPAEVVEVRAWSTGAVDAALGSGLFTPNFEHEWRLYRRETASPVG